MQNHAMPNQPAAILSPATLAKSEENWRKRGQKPTSSAFASALDPVSMKELKCLEGRGEVVCHAPSPFSPACATTSFPACAGSNH